MSRFLSPPERIPEDADDIRRGEVTFENVEGDFMEDIRGVKKAET